MGRAKTEKQLETEFQLWLTSEELPRRFPGCWIFFNDPQIQQGIPDLTILWNTYWAMLEVKAYAGAPEQPNQGYWVDHFGNMSFAAFIHPENAEEVLNAMEQAFRPSRSARVSQR